MMQLLKKRKPQLDAAQQDLLRQLFDAKTALDSARRKFEYVTEPEMISSCIYEMRAEQARYTYLLGKVRDLGITLSDRSLLRQEESRRADPYF